MPGYAIYRMVSLLVKLDKKQQAVILFLVLVIVFGGVYRLALVRANSAGESRPALQRNAGEAAGEGKAKEVVVHVAGAVKSPGIIRLPQGARVADALEKAAPLPDADTDMLNLAAPVTDGQKITVPAKGLPAAGAATASGSGGAGGVQKNPSVSGTAPSSGPAAGTTGAAAGLVNINTADASRLDTLPGIGPALAQRIIEYRELHGPFKSLEDLKNVSGIGDKKFDDLKDKITIW